MVVANGECPYGEGVNAVVLAEAFRRAQMVGRVYPTIAEFPPSVSRDAVEHVYLPFIHSDVMSRMQNVRVSQPTHPIYTCAPDAVSLRRCSMNSSDCLLTLGGDAITAFLPLAEVLGQSFF